MNKNDNLLKTEAEIKNWLNEMNIDEYIIHDDLTVDINQNVYLIGKKLTHLPIKLGMVNGDFNIYKNYLTSLENFPHTVAGDLDCSENAIDSLMNSPVKKVGETFNCSENYISNLKGMPNSLNNIDCSNNPIKIDDFIDVHFSNESIVLLHHIENENDMIKLFEKQYQKEHSSNLGTTYQLLLSKHDFDNAMKIFKEKNLFEKIINQRVNNSDDNLSSVKTQKI